LTYLWLKAFHITAAMTWVGGMLVVAVTLVGAGRGDTDGGGPLPLAFVRRWDRSVTTPAMLVVWALGLSLAKLGEWFPQPWLLAKLAVVLALSAVHGMLSGRLRRLDAGGPASAGALPYAPAAIVGCVLLIVVLVVTKPF
jgi:uncharacterized membrane protein